MANKIISVLAGTDYDYNGTATISGTGAPYTGFVSNDSITALVYSGENQGVTFSPTVTWTSAPAGTYVLSFHAADTANVTPGRYVVRVQVTRAADSRIIPVFQGWLEIRDSPGTATAPTTYNSFNDLLNYAPWLEKEQTVHALSGYVNHRHLARTWLESTIQAKWLASGFSLFGDLLIYYNPVNYGAESIQLQEWLDQDLLMIKPIVLELTSRKTIQLICESLVSPSTKDQPYRDYAKEQKAEVDRLIKTYVAEIDLNNDGVAEVVINCNVSTIGL